MAQPSPETHDVAVETDHPVPMRDGVTLRADVYRPTGPGRYPVLLCRTPYDKALPRNAALARGLAARGYIVALQDTRGRFASDGEFYWQFGNSEKTHEGPDGYDTVEWAAALPGSDGRVGTYGNSYNGYTSWMAAGALPPSLKGLYASGMSAKFTQMTFGVFDTGRRLQWTFAQAADARRRAGMPKPHTAAEAEWHWTHVERQKWIWFVPLDEIPERAFSSLTPMLREHLREQVVENWDFTTAHPHVAIPTCQSTGWYDRLNGTIHNFTGMVQNGPAAVRDQHRLVVGPWGHNTNNLVGKQGVMDFGPAAAADYGNLVGRWYDWQFKDVDNGLAAEPPVRLFVMGANEWRLESQWPPADVQFTPWYLHSGGRANSPAGDGTLSPEEPGAEPPDRYHYDPRDPVMSLMGLESHLAPADQRPLDDRTDVLVYQTPPLTEAMELIGPVAVHLWIVSSAPDTDFTAKLVDVHPDGLAVNLCHGIARCRYREGFATPRLMTPGERYAITIPMLPTAVRLAPGHRLRLDIASSDFPNFDRNHNTGREFYEDPEFRTARQTVFHEPRAASHVLLPLMPAR